MVQRTACVKYRKGGAKQAMLGYHTGPSCSCPTAGAVSELPAPQGEPMAAVQQSARLSIWDLHCRTGHPELSNSSSHCLPTLSKRATAIDSCPEKLQQYKKSLRNHEEKHQQQSQGLSSNMRSSHSCSYIQLLELKTKSGAIDS